MNKGLLKQLILEKIDNNKWVGIIDDRTDILEEVSQELRIKLLRLLPKDDLKEAQKLLSYPEESTGRLMTPEYVALSPKWTPLL